MLSLQALLRAMADRLIPGIPLSIRIAILQQTAEDGTDVSESAKSASKKKTVLAMVLEADSDRNQLLQELNGEE